MIPLTRITANPHQPRREFEPGALADLEASIREHGILQPVVVRPSGEGFQLVAGERRLRASRNVGLAEIPALVRAVSDQGMLTLALVENIQREDLNPIEKARAFRDLLATARITQEEAAKVLGKDRTSIANTIRLLDLPADLQAHVSRGTLSAGHARALLALEDEDAMRVLAARIVAEGLSVRETEKAVAGPTKVVGTAVPGKPRRERSSHLVELEDHLRRSLGTRVAIPAGRGKRGRIVVHYASLEEFDRIFEILTGPAESAAPPARAAG